MRVFHKPVVWAVKGCSVSHRDPLLTDWSLVWSLMKHCWYRTSAQKVWDHHRRRGLNGRHTATEITCHYYHYNYGPTLWRYLLRYPEWRNLYNEFTVELCGWGSLVERLEIHPGVITSGQRVNIRPQKSSRSRGRQKVPMPESIGNKWDDLEFSILNENFKWIETVTVGPSHRSNEDSFPSLPEKMMGKN